MLEISNFSKSYSGKKILDINHLIIPNGIHWITGENGVGKSTLLRCIGGMIPFAGDISWNGVSQRLKPVSFRLKVNLSEAEPIYPEYLSGYDLLLFVNKAKRGTTKALLEIADRFGISAYWRSPFGTYSSGMLKKVGLVAAFLGHPELIILDEPLVTIDTKTVSLIFELIDELSNNGISFILSSHQSLEHLPLTHIYKVENLSMSRV